MAKKFKQMWITQHGSVFPAMVAPYNGRYRTQFSAMIYPANAVHEWNELTPRQKKTAWESCFSRKKYSIAMAKAKDPTLAEQAENWKRQAQDALAHALERIDSGEPADEPNPYD